MVNDWQDNSFNQDPFVAACHLVDEKLYRSHESAEISPKSGLVIQEVANRIVEFGGAAILAGNQLITMLTIW